MRARLRLPRQRFAVLAVSAALALGLAIVLSGQALQLIRERSRIARRATAAQLDEMARTVALRTEYQLLTPMATALGRAALGDSGRTMQAPTVTQFAGRAERYFSPCQCMAPNGLALRVQGATRRIITTNRSDTTAHELTGWVADTLPGQVVLPHLAGGTLIGGGGRIVFGFLATSSPRPAHLFGYIAHFAPGDTIDDIFAIELDPRLFLPRALADSAIHPGTNDGPLAFQARSITVDVTDASNRTLYVGDGGRWEPGLRAAALPVDVARLTLRIYPVHDPGNAMDRGAPASGVGGLLLVLALFGVTVLLSAVAVLQLRGEHELGRRRARFVSGVSHELRTPLTQIRLFAELLRDDNPAVQANRYDYARIIDEEAQRLTYLVDNVLTFSALEDGATAVRGRPVDLGDVIMDTIDRFAPLARARSAVIETGLAEGVIAVADADAVHRILLNVLDNAVKYGPQGQTIRVGLATTGEDAVLTVDDQGPGIPVGDRVRVFEPFVRLDGDRPAPSGGSGIGLAIVRDLMSALRGRVSIEDAAPRGTRVRLTFPLSPITVPEVARP